MRRLLQANFVFLIDMITFRYIPGIFALQQI